MNKNIDWVHHSAVLKEKLMKIAQQTCWCDDEEQFMPYDYAGGNIDDAYSGGADDGKGIFARELLKEFWGEIHNNKTCQPR